MSEFGLEKAKVIPDSIVRATSNGRGVEVFRPSEAAAFLGVSVKEIKSAMRTFDLSEGKRGLAHFQLGKGALIRRGALETWMRSLEDKQAKGA
jgi:hypothetical protein